METNRTQKDMIDEMTQNLAGLRNKLHITTPQNPKKERFDNKFVFSTDEKTSFKGSLSTDELEQWLKEKSDALVEKTEALEENQDAFNVMQR